MAYKTSSASTFLSLDGVPFIIGTKFRPPKKVTLPLQFETGNPSEILFMEYDTSLEEKILVKLTAEREAENAIVRVNGTSAKSKDDVSTGAQDHVLPPGDKIHESSAVGENQKKNLSEMTNTAVSFALPTTTTRAGNQIKNEAVTSSSLNNRPVYQMMNGNILVPTQIATPGECRDDACKTMFDDFDIKDFENEQDPFENLSLRVMNDREELDKVFLVTSKSQPMTLEEVTTMTAGVANPSNATGDTTFDVKSSKELNSNDEQFRSGHENNAVLLTGRTARYFRPASDVVVASINYATAPVIAPKNASGMPWLPSPSNAPGIANERLVGDFPNPRLYENLNTNLKNTWTSQSFNQPCLATSLADCDASAGSVAMTTPWPMKHTTTGGYSVDNNAYHLLYDGYSMAYQYPASSSTSTALNKTSIRSAKSNPDLSATGGGTPSSGVVGGFGRHTPPFFERNIPSFQNDKHQLSSVKDVAASSQLNDFKRKSEKIVVETSNVEEKMFSCLSIEAKTFVDFVTAMGFSKLHTICAVERLGIDEKLVLDHLCALTQLMEKGHRPENAGKALFLFNSQLDKAESYLNHVQTFRSMGFDEERINKSLVVCNLDEEKALDWLTS